MDMGKTYTGIEHMAAMKDIKVAISSEFMSAFAAIPKKMQGKVLEFITKFRKTQ